MSKFAAWVKREGKEILPALVFLFVALHLAAFVEELMVEGRQFTVSRFVTVTVGALVVAKCMLLAKFVPGVGGEGEGTGARVWRIAWRTVVYGCLVLLFKCVEHAVPIVRAHGFGGAPERLLQETDWGRFWGIAIVLLALLAAYCTGEEAVRIIGKRRAMAEFFGVGESEGRGAR